MSSDNRCVICLQYGHKSHNCPQGRYLPKATMKHFITSLALLAAATVHAEGMAPDFLNLGGPSYHFDGDGKRVNGFNEANAGLGLTWAKRDVWLMGETDVSVGAYYNSERRPTAYATLHKLPLEILGARAGITMGLATGYRLAPVVPLVAPTACWKYACAMLLPPLKGVTAGVISLQFRVPL